LLAFAKSVILGPSLALLGSKYKRPSGEENKNPNNLKVTVLKQVSKNLLPVKFSENRFFLSCIGVGDRYSKSLLMVNSNKFNLTHLNFANIGHNKSYPASPSGRHSEIWSGTWYLDVCL